MFQKVLQIYMIIWNSKCILLSYILHVEFYFSWCNIWAFMMEHINNPYIFVLTNFVVPHFMSALAVSLHFVQMFHQEEKVIKTRLVGSIFDWLIDRSIDRSIMLRQHENILVLFQVDYNSNFLLSGEEMISYLQSIYSCNRPFISMRQLQE